MLKIRPFENFIGNDQAYSYIGIRWDEDREGYRPSKPPSFSERPNIIPVYPLKDDKMGFSDIEELLESSGLGFPDYYEWRSRSGCYFCFYQQIGEWQGLKEQHPLLFEKAKRMRRSRMGRHTHGLTVDLSLKSRISKIGALFRNHRKPVAAICHL